MTRLKPLISPLNVNIEAPLLISGDKIIKLFVIPVKEVKLVRPLNTFFSDPIFSHVVPKFQTLSSFNFLKDKVGDLDR
jgi:hypothetical protein